MNDDNSELEEHKIDRQRRALLGETGGASITVSDPRVSKFMSWFWGALGCVFVSGVYWVAASINDLNTNVVRILAQNEAVLRRLDSNEGVDDRQDVEIRELENRVGIIDGRTMRGPPGAIHGR